MPSESDFQGLWQGQPVETVRLSVDDLRRRALRFERRIQRRNGREYVGGAIALALLIPQALHNHGWFFVSTLCSIVAVVYVVVQVWRRGAASAPSDAGARGWLQYHRRELARQRDALRTVWTWYLLPFVPGFAILLVAMWVAQRRGVVWVGLAMVAMLGGVGALNSWAAKRLDRKIQELDQMEVGDE